MYGIFDKLMRTRFSWDLESVVYVVYDTHAAIGWTASTLSFHHLTAISCYMLHVFSF